MGGRIGYADAYARSPDGIGNFVPVDWKAPETVRFPQGHLLSQRLRVELRFILFPGRERNLDGIATHLAILHIRLRFVQWLNHHGYLFPTIGAGKTVFDGSHAGSYRCTARQFGITNRRVVTAGPAWILTRYTPGAHVPVGRVHL